MKKEKIQKEKILEPKTIIAWVVLVLFIVGVILIYVFFKKEPSIEPKTIEDLQKITEESYNKLENPTSPEDLRRINIERRNSNQKRTPLEEIQSLNAKNSL